MSEPVAVGDYPGIHVEFHESPYRHYLVNGTKAVSVTTAIGVLNKPLEAWVERTTLGGAVKLLRKSNYTLPANMEPAECPWKSARYVPKWACDSPSSNCVGHDPALCQFRVDLKARRLDFYAEKKEAADRGVDVHKVWQDWGEQALIPNVSEYPPNRHGYIRGLAKFIVEHQPKCLETEQVVGSVEHLFAGRLDTVVVLDLDGKPSLVDLKTSRDVYANSMFPQLAGYEIARRECGLPPSERQGILQVSADGKYKLAWSDATADDFLAILNCWKSQQRWKRR